MTNKKPARYVVERLSDIQEELERVIAKKFVGTLKDKERRMFTSPEKPTNERWPDFYAKEGTINWAIELTELLEPEHADAWKRQQDYLTTILHQLGGIPEFLNGIDVLIVDNYQEPPFPKVNTPEGEKIINIVVNELNILAQDLTNLSIHKWLVRDLTGKQDVEQCLKLACFRFASSNTFGRIKFSGTFPIPVDDAQHLLEHAILKKIKINYPSLAGHKLLLLVYDIRMGGIASSVTDQVALSYAHHVLQSHKHPFEEVWYFYPYAERDQGHLIRVWPI